MIYDSRSGTFTQETGYGGGASGNAAAAAYGTKPAGPVAMSTAPQVVPQAVGAQSSVYGQLPGYGASLANIGKNIQSETAGQLPPDVVRAITQGAAERGVATGNIGGANTNAALLRAMGLTSLDLTGRGQQEFLAQLPALPGAGIAANPGFYVNPGQQYEADLQRSIFAAAPDPAAAAKASMANVAAGFGAGRGSVGGFSGLNYGGNSPALDNMTTGYPNIAPVGALNPSGTGAGAEPGSPGAYAAWNAWNNPGAASPVDNILGRYSPTVLGEETAGATDLTGSYGLGDTSDLYPGDDSNY